MVRRVVRTIGPARVISWPKWKGTRLPSAFPLHSRRRRELGPEWETVIDRHCDDDPARARENYRNRERVDEDDAEARPSGSLSTPTRVPWYRRREWGEGDQLRCRKQPPDTWTRTGHIRSQTAESGFDPPMGVGRCPPQRSYLATFIDSQFGQVVSPEGTRVPQFRHSYISAGSSLLGSNSFTNRSTGPMSR